MCGKLRRGLQEGGALRNIDLIGQRLPAGRADAGNHRFAAREVQVAHCHGSTTARELLGHRAAKAARCASDEDLLA